MLPLPALLASLVCGGGELEYIFSLKRSFFHQRSSVLVVMPSSHSKSDEVAAGASSAQLTNTSFQVISFSKKRKAPIAQKEPRSWYEQGQVVKKRFKEPRK